MPAYGDENAPPARAARRSSAVFAPGMTVAQRKAAAAERRRQSMEFKIPKTPERRNPSRRQTIATFPPASTRSPLWERPQPTFGPPVMTPEQSLVKPPRPRLSSEELERREQEEDRRAEAVFAGNRDAMAALDGLARYHDQYGASELSDEAGVAEQGTQADMVEPIDSERAPVSRGRRSSGFSLLLAELEEAERQAAGAVALAESRTGSSATPAGRQTCSSEAQTAASPRNVNPVENFGRLLVSYMAISSRQNMHIASQAFAFLQRKRDGVIMCLQLMRANKPALDGSKDRRRLWAVGWGLAVFAFIPLIVVAIVIAKRKHRDQAGVRLLHQAERLLGTKSEQSLGSEIQARPWVGADSR